MAISSLAAARKICELSGWTVTNLSLQKILYFAHMVHIGRHSEPLVDEPFQAWDYGPVLPSVYHRAKVFGARPVRNVFHSAPAIEERRTLETLTDAFRVLEHKTPGQLVAITHWDNGAWAKHYTGERSEMIPHEDVRAEYHQRMHA